MNVFVSSEVYRVGCWRQDSDRSEEMQKKYIMYQDRRNDNPCLSQIKPTTCSTIPHMQVYLVLWSQ